MLGGMEPSLAVRLGLVIRKQRGELFYTQEALADAAGINRSHMQRIESGALSIRLETAEKIAAKLGVPLSQLIQEAENLNVKRPEPPG